MPRSRESEGPQRQSIRRGPPPLRTSSSDSNSTNHRSITVRSPMLGDRRSPRGSQSDPIMSQKKLGTRISDLESQLGQAQLELKNLKGELANAEAAKKEAQELLEKKIKKPKARYAITVEDKHSADSVEVPYVKDDKNNNHHENPDENDHETDVFEVPIEKVKVEDSATGMNKKIDEEIVETKPTSESIESPSFDDLVLKDEEIDLLKGKLEEKDKEIEISHQVNENLKKQLNEAVAEKTTNEIKLVEMIMKLTQLGQELEGSRKNEAEFKKKLEGMEVSKEKLEAEMKKMKVQTEQWRKAADAAATILACDTEMNGRRVSERCGSMDKHIGHMFDSSSVGGYNGHVGSPGLCDDFDDGFGGGKRRSSSIRMFGDLWRKKGQK